MSIEIFQKNIGYFFKNPQLLQTAFTHTSYANENNIGIEKADEDKVIDMAVKLTGYEKNSDDLKTWMENKDNLKMVEDEVKIQKVLNDNQSMSELAEQKRSKAIDKYYRADYQT